MAASKSKDDFVESPFTRMVQRMVPKTKHGHGLHNRPHHNTQSSKPGKPSSAKLPLTLPATHSVALSRQNQVELKPHSATCLTPSAAHVNQGTYRTLALSSPYELPQEYIMLNNHVSCKPSQAQIFMLCIADSDSFNCVVTSRTGCVNRAPPGFS